MRQIICYCSLKKKKNHPNKKKSDKKAWLNVSPLVLAETELGAYLVIWNVSSVYIPASLLVIASRIGGASFLVSVWIPSKFLEGVFQDVEYS